MDNEIYNFLNRILTSPIGDVGRTEKSDHDELGRWAKKDGTDQSATYQSAEDVKKALEGTDQWMKAPNGKDTNLNEKQWCEVRTENFKNWFGDWENDPDNASKMVDENGEPVVLYHGTKADFDTFRNNAFFTTNHKYAEGYAGNEGKILSVYLNIRKPFDIRNKQDYKIFTQSRNGHEPAKTNSGAIDWAEFEYYDAEYEEGLQHYLNENYHNKYDGIFLDEGGDPDGNGGYTLRGLSYVPFNSNQIKSAENNNGNFSKDKDRIYDSKKTN